MTVDYINGRKEGGELIKLILFVRGFFFHFKFGVFWKSFRFVAVNYYLPAKKYDTIYVVI